MSPLRALARPRVLPRFFPNPIRARSPRNIMTGAGEPPMKVQRTEEPVLQVKKLSEHAILPVRGSPGAAGEDS